MYSEKYGKYISYPVIKLNKLLSNFDLIILLVSFVANNQFPMPLLILILNRSLPPLLLLLISLYSKNLKTTMYPSVLIISFDVWFFPQFLLSWNKCAILCTGLRHQWKTYQFVSNSLTLSNTFKINLKINTSISAKTIYIKAYTNLANKLTSSNTVL